MLAEKSLKTVLPGILLALLLGLGYFQIGFKHSFMADSFYKLYQTHSLIENNFTSEEYIYPARNLDEDFTYFIRNGPPFLVQAKGKYVGQYPVIFSLVSAPFYYLFGEGGLYLLNILPMLGLAWLLRRFWGVSWLYIYIAIFTTPLLIFMVDFNEYPLFLFLNGLGFTLILRQTETSHRLAGGFLMGLTFWFRLEAVLFLTAFTLALLIASGLLQFKIKELFRRYLGLIIAMALPLLLFVIYNTLAYDHILGSRFLGNLADPTAPAPTPENPFYQTFKTTFIYLLGGYYKPGLLGYTPAYLLMFYFLYRKSFRSNIEQDYRILLNAVFIFIPMTILVLNWDPIISWGPRYIALSYFPLIIIGGQVFERIRADKPGRLLTIIFIIFSCYSLYITRLGIYNFTGSTKQIGQVQQKLLTVESDIRLFQSELLLAVNGRGYFKDINLKAEDLATLNQAIAMLKEKASGRRLSYFELNIDVNPPEDQNAKAASSSPGVIDSITGFLKSITRQLEHSDLTGSDKELYRQALLKTFQLEEKQNYGEFTVYHLRIR